jgi:hypothetical protein
MRYGACGMNDYLIDELSEAPKGNTCRTCDLIFRVQCGGKGIHYCGGTKSNRTECGYKKVRCIDWACELYRVAE